MSKREHLLIIGNSGSAIQAVRGIRSINRDCDITIVSKEACDAYAPILTTYLISGKVGKANIKLVKNDFYVHNRVDVKYNTNVAELNTCEKTVIVDDESPISYDKILIATGASPNPLELNYPAELPVYTLRTLKDAEKIRSCIPNAGKVIFCGAGLVSLQIASALGKSLSQMTFIVGSNQILSQNLDARSAALVQERIEAHGGRFLFGTKIVEIEALHNENGIMVHTDHGKVFRGDALVVGKGVRPNILETLPNGSTKIGTGILVDERQQSSVEGVYAAGDVCESVDLISGERRVIATWPNACSQGWVAGRNMGGSNAFFSGSLAMNVTTLFGFSVASIGHVRDVGAGEKEDAIYIDASSGIYKKWVFHNDRMIGAVLFNDLSEFSLATQIIRRQQSIPKEKEAMMAYPGRSSRILSGLAQFGSGSVYSS